jgi:lysophospholipase L1-like esterase
MALTLTDAQRRMVRFLHYEKALALMPGLSEELLATLNGLALDDYRAARAQCADEAREAARELLADAVFAASADRLPFAPGAVVVGLGDSITDDLLSWFEILRQLCDLRRPDDKVQFVNAGIFGDTTSQIISRFFAVADRNPDWIICFAGTNDARRHGHQPLKTLVSPSETEQNLAALRHFGATQTSAQWLWVTPATVVEEQIASDPFLSGRQVMWRNDDLRVAADAVRRQSGPIVDLQPLFGTPANPAYLLSDGLHPNLAGQKVIAQAVVEGLSKVG